jgi:hypothetical protein
VKLYVVEKKGMIDRRLQKKMGDTHSDHLVLFRLDLYVVRLVAFTTDCPSAFELMIDTSRGRNLLSRTGV